MYAEISILSEAQRPRPGTAGEAEHGRTGAARPGSSGAWSWAETDGTVGAGPTEVKLFAEILGPAVDHRSAHPRHRPADTSAQTVVVEADAYRGTPPDASRTAEPAAIASRSPAATEPARDPSRGGEPMLFADAELGPIRPAAAAPEPGAKDCEGAAPVIRGFSPGQTEFAFFEETTPSKKSGKKKSAATAKSKSGGSSGKGSRRSKAKASAEAAQSMEQAQPVHPLPQPQPPHPAPPADSSPATAPAPAAAAQRPATPQEEVAREAAGPGHNRAAARPARPTRPVRTPRSDFTPRENLDAPPPIAGGLRGDRPPQPAAAAPAAGHAAPSDSAPHTAQAGIRRSARFTPRRRAVWERPPGIEDIFTPMDALNIAEHVRRISAVPEGE
ncbi:hypothetical protein DB346_16805 [Verrucomicrobia bacterium LW23]|nr:hypothetical protein DB346_16805 [Verrucomicrobia bacterium LW23]